MVDYFAKDLERFFSERPDLSQSDVSYRDALKIVCADAQHLARTPKMMDLCCPPMMNPRQDASRRLMEAVVDQVEHCSRARAGWRDDAYTNEAEEQRHRLETGQMQRIIEIATQAACSDSSFARKHVNLCCTTFNDGRAQVSKACSLGRM